MAGIDGLKGFRTLSPGDRERVAGATREQRTPAGKVLFAEGQVADTLWAVKAGVVHIVKSGAAGREIVLEVVPPGELFGAVVALEGRPYPASAVAAEDSVVWRKPAALARELCQKHPTLRSSILEQVTTRLRGAHDRMRSIALERVEQRVLYMSNKYLESAIQTFKMVANAVPNNASTWNHIGICYKELGKPEESKFYFDRARDIHIWKKDTPINPKRNEVL